MISEIVDEFKRRLPWFPFDAADLKDLSDEELTKYYREVCQGESPQI